MIWQSYIYSFDSAKTKFSFCSNRIFFVVLNKFLYHSFATMILLISATFTTLFYPHFVWFTTRLAKNFLKCVSKCKTGFIFCEIKRPTHEYLLKVPIIHRKIAFIYCGYLLIVYQKHQHIRSCPWRTNIFSFA